MSMQNAATFDAIATVGVSVFRKVGGASSTEITEPLCPETSIPHG